MKTHQELLKSVNNYLSENAYHRRPQGLYDPINYVLEAGGKRLRPVLMLLAYSLYKDDVDTILPVAAGIETYHNYTLLHDDLMDCAEMRRGKTTVHVKWNDNTAILSGDAMLVLAYERLAKCREEKLKDVLDVFSKTAQEITEGQQYDMDFEARNDVTQEEYLEMIRLKTSVLLAAALKIGAILADATQNDIDRLYRFGEKLGLAFQLQDDYLDVYGSPETFGKNIGGDILCNKKTFMLINAFQRANAKQRKELECWIKDTEPSDSQKKIKAVTRLYDDIGIRQLAEQHIKHYFEACIFDLSGLQVSDERKQPLLDYAKTMMHRTY